MPHVRSVAVGIWLTRGSRHEPDAHPGIAHFVEHMLFKGTDRRSAEDIAQEIDSIGGQLDAFTAKEYASYYIKVLDEHLPIALDILSDIVLNPAFAPDDILREKKVILEEIKMVDDTPDDLVHELFTQGFWEDHPLGRPILGTGATVATALGAGIVPALGPSAPQAILPLPSETLTNAISCGMPKVIIFAISVGGIFCELTQLVAGLQALE